MEEGQDDQSIKELESLNVNVVQQEELEKDLNAKLNKTIAEQEDAVDQKRLSKAESKLQMLRSKMEALKKRSTNPYSKISEKQIALKQIRDLEQRDIASAETEISEIKLRMNKRQDALTGSRAADEQAGGSSRLPNETERDYLVRTGKITAFGNTSSFSVGNQEQMPLSKEEAIDETESKHKLKIKDEDMDYIDEEDEEEEDSGEEGGSEYELSDVEPSSVKKRAVEKQVKSRKAVVVDNGLENDDLSAEEDVEIAKLDDGDENHYQARLKKWVAERTSLRQSKGLTKPADKEEWFLPHPNYNDAVLNDQFRVPGEIFNGLFEYQKTCVQWLWELYSQKVGGIIGDEMGLGKTIQVISFLASLFYSGKLTRPVLIVCPSTVMKQWVNEFHTWWAPFRVVILHSIGSGMQNNISQRSSLEDELYELVEEDDEDNRIKKSLSAGKLRSKAEVLVKRVFSKGHVIITTYAGLKSYSKILLNQRWGYAVLDEGHKIRNPNAEVSLTAKRLRTPNRIILSGTPIQNNLTELWSLFDFVYPGKLGTLPIFQQEFVVPINMGGYANASNVQVQTSLKCAVALKNLISPYLLRRLKSDVAKDLPKKSEMVLFCKLTSFQQKKYLEFLKSSDAESILSGKKNALYGIDILKKICNHPDLLLLSTGHHLKDYEGEHGDDDANYKITKKRFGDPAFSGKMQVLKTLILLWKSEGHKILLFTQTKQMLNILENFVNHLYDTKTDNKVNYLRMDGSTPIKDRQTLMDLFNNTPDLHLFLLTTRVGGLGVNLIGADRVIIFDPDWNPSTDIQARERAWRLGQKKDVTIYRLMTKGTIEEKIYQRQIFKQFLSNKVLKDPNQKRVFKMSQLNDLFTYGSDDEDDDGTRYRNSRFGKASKKPANDDFLKVAKITGVAKLEKFNTGEGDDDSTSSSVSMSRKRPRKDEDRVLGDLLESSGIKASIQHDDIENASSAKDKDSIIQKEAEKIASEAVSSLMKSRKMARQHRIGTPTWTGKFGSAGKVVKKRAIKGSTNGNFSSQMLKIRFANDANTSGLALTSAAPSAMTSDAEIRSVSPADETRFKTFTSKLVENKEKILQDVRDFLQSQPNNFSSSKPIIEHLNFSMQSESDIKLIRTLLRQIATWDKSKSGWVLKDDFKGV